MGLFPHDPGEAERHPGTPTRGEREVESREEALLQSPIGTVVDRQLADEEGHLEDVPGHGVRLESSLRLRVEGPPGW